MEMWRLTAWARGPSHCFPATSSHRQERSDWVGSKRGVQLGVVLVWDKRR
jgi:hypothetical protein